MDIEKQYVEGFNAGYILAKHEPDFLLKIVNGVHSTTDYLEGLSSGKEEYELEHFKAHENELKNIRSKSQNRENERERDV
jgi:hypothetical protein